MRDMECTFVSCEVSPVQPVLVRFGPAVLSCSFDFSLPYNIPVHEQMDLGNWHWWAL